jgi:lipoprotein-anchoring transpeptidase ErfK/SrfK
VLFAAAPQISATEKAIATVSLLFMPVALNAERYTRATIRSLSIRRRHGPLTTSADVLLPRPGTRKAQIGCTILAGWCLRNQGQDMPLLASPRHFRSLIRSLAIVAPLAAIIVFPASAQTNADPTSTGPAVAPAQTQATGVPTNPDPAAAKVNSAAPGTTNSTAAKPETQPAAAQPQSNPETKKAGSTILITINKAKQKMTVSLDGIQKYEWPVSTGRAGYSTPSGTYTATSMNEIWYSKEWDNSPMPHSIFFMKDGHAIHGSYEVKNLGKAVSHGCVRISPQNATILYALVKANGLGNTQVVLTGTTPGGEFKYARGQENPGYGFYEPSYGSPPPYYNGPRAYYQWSPGYSRW